jgi:hypothetical protein
MFAGTVQMKKNAPCGAFQILFTFPAVWSVPTAFCKTRVSSMFSGMDYRALIYCSPKLCILFSLCRTIVVPGKVPIIAYLKWETVAFFTRELK